MTKSKKQTQTNKAETSRAKNLGQSNTFFTFGAKKTFIELKQAFVKVFILNHFDPKRHIYIKTDTSSYTISRILSQLILDDLDQWYPMAFFSSKMIPTKT